jgi:hypothetical protein
MDDRFEIMDHTVEHPLHVHFALAPHGQTISALLRPHIPTDWFPNGEPLAIDRTGCWRVSLRDHLVGPGLVGWLDKDGQMFAACLSMLYTLLAQQTCTAIRFIGFLAAGEVVADFWPTGLQLYAFPLRTPVALMCAVVGAILYNALLARGRCVALLGGKAGIAWAQGRVRDIRIKLFLGTRLEIACPRVIPVGTEALALARMPGPPDGLHVGFGPGQQRRDMPIILPVARGLSLHHDLLFCIHQGLAVVPLEAPLEAPMGRLHLRRVVSGDITLPCFTPLARLRFVLVQKYLKASSLLRSSLNLFVYLGLRRAMRSCPGDLALVIGLLMLFQ